MLDLRPPQLELLEAIGLELSQISGVVAVVSGGSHARGSAQFYSGSTSHFVRAGTRSRAIRRRLSDNHIRCSAPDRRWFPARPVQHVHRRRNNGKGRIQSALASVHLQIQTPRRLYAHRPTCFPSRPNPRVLCLTRRRNVEFGCLQDGFLGQVHKYHGILVTDPVNMAW